MSAPLIFQASIKNRKRQHVFTGGIFSRSPAMLTIGNLPLLNQAITRLTASSSPN